MYLHMRLKNIKLLCCFPDTPPFYQYAGSFMEYVCFRYFSLFVDLTMGVKEQIDMISGYTGSEQSAQNIVKLRAKQNLLKQQ